MLTQNVLFESRISLLAKNEDQKGDDPEGSCLCMIFVFGLKKSRSGPVDESGWASRLSTRMTGHHSLKVNPNISLPDGQFTKSLRDFSKMELPQGFLADTSHGHFTRICLFGSGESQFPLYCVFQSFLNAALGDVP